MEVAIAGPEITASSPPYVVTVAATIATFNATRFKESVLAVLRARGPGRAMLGVVVEVLSLREKDSAAHAKFRPQATVLEVTFQVVVLPACRQRRDSACVSWCRWLGGGWKTGDGAVRGPRMAAGTAKRGEEGRGASTWSPLGTGYAAHAPESWFHQRTLDLCP